jgi:hypothetical protein
MTQSNPKRLPFRTIPAPLLGIVVGIFWQSQFTAAQPPKRPQRAAPPTFEAIKLEGIFYPDVRKALNGQFPADVDLQKSGLASQGPVSDANAAASLSAAMTSGQKTDSPLQREGLTVQAWNELISATVLEDLIKESKQRLDRAITNPAAFSGGGFRDARREISLLSLLFAIIEEYPGEVRWKSSSPAVRAAMTQMATNIKAGSRQNFEQAQRLQQDLDDLLRGSPWRSEPKTAIVWENLIDPVPMMQVLDQTYRESVTQASANPEVFSRRQEDLLRAAELISVLAAVATFENMPNADDDIFRDLAMEMLIQAQRIRSAISQNDPEEARVASGQLGQACIQCHESFR